MRWATENMETGTGTETGKHKLTRLLLKIDLCHKWGGLH